MTDARWMAAAVALSERGRARTATNPNVGCLIVKDGRVIGRGWTQDGGRPHAEAMALAASGLAANGATAYVTLEPCAHISARGPSCADSLIDAGIAHLYVAIQDPDPRTNGEGIRRIREAGITVTTGSLEAEARRAMAGWLMQQENGRPFITLKLATSLDGCIALANGESRWITGPAARAHGHLERARSNLILVGRGTFDADTPSLDVRLPGLEACSPDKLLLTSGQAPLGWTALPCPQEVHMLSDAQYLLIEGGAAAAAAFVKADLVDRLLLHRAPILLGGGKSALADTGLDQLSGAHGQWQRSNTRQLGSDMLEVYERVRETV